MTAKPNKLSVAGTLSHLEKFTAGIHSFFEREKGIARARQLRESSHRQNVEEQCAELEREHAAAISRVREQDAAYCAMLNDHHARRRLRIDRAQIVVRNEVIARLQASEGQHRAGLQREFMDAGNRRERRLSAAIATYEQGDATAKRFEARFGKMETAAARGLWGFSQLHRRFLSELKATEIPLPGEVTEGALEERFVELSGATKVFRRAPLVALFSGFPVTLQGILVIGAAAGAPLVAPSLGFHPTWGLSLGIAVAVLATLLVFWFVGRLRATRFLDDFLDSFVEGKEMRLRFRESVEARYRASEAEIEAEYEAVKTTFQTGLRSTPVRKGETNRSKYSGTEAVEKRAAELKDQLGRLEKFRIDSIHQSLANRIEALEKSRHERRETILTGKAQEASSLIEPLEALEAEWGAELLPILGVLKEESNEESMAPDWLTLGGVGWEAPLAFSGFLKFAELRYSATEGELVLPQSERMHVPGSLDFHLPLRLKIPEIASLLLETRNHGRTEAIELLNLLVLGWLASAPPGRLSFSLIDPLGLGESFAGLMHLADYDEILINTRIRTQDDQIERRLGELCDHMEKVIQMYLRSDFETITQYNEAAGTIAERYHFLVVADFPRGFTDLAAKRLLSIAASGARCGVFLLIHYDKKIDLPHGFLIDDLRNACLVLQGERDGFHVKGNAVKGTSLSLLKPPSPPQFVDWIHRIGAGNRDSNRIEVPFSFIAPTVGERWTLSTASELRVPIGRSGATKLQYLALGKGTCQHALIAGKTGSGKSTLFHIIISNLALWCSPDEVEFYLIDFKKGVEFKCYADQHLPHARVIAIESDREFGLSVLQRLDEELRHRGDLFRAAGVQDMKGYRETAGAPSLPRTLLLIDEFQEFFTEDDPISQQAAVLLDRIVRQGRAFGIHAVLGSQTLGGAFTLARATLGQMTVRIALACNEADAYLIMDDSNAAPRMLTRPGEGIYNDRAGASEANSPFQVVWMHEKERDTLLHEIEQKSLESGTALREQVVFEGNVPPEIARDAAVNEVLTGTSAERKAGPPRIFLGAPNAIKGPTEVVFHRQNGANLLVVGQREDAVDAMVLVGLRQLRARFGRRIRLILIDGRLNETAEPGFFAKAVERIGGVECPDLHQMGEVLNSLASEMKSISEGETPDSGVSTLVFVPNLHRYKKLRYEEDYSFSLDSEAEVKPSTSLHELICEGPGWGYHVMISLDSYNNVSRCLGRKAAGEFEMKVLFQMSASDSASLIDSGKAADLGMNRTLFYDETSGLTELFRPYALPPLEWFG